MHKAMNNMVCEKQIQIEKNTGSYKTDIANTTSIILQKSKQAKTEADTANIFKTELYYFVKSHFKVSLDFKNEVRLNGIQHIFGQSHKKGKTGRMDAIVNNLIIEYKHYKKLEKENDILSAINQVKEYLNALKKNQKDVYRAILTDGIKICYFDFSNNKIIHSNLSLLTSKDIEIIIGAILSNSQKKFVSENILKDFFIDSNVESISKDVAKVLYSNLKNKPTAKTRMLFQEWQALMHLSIDDNGKSNDIRKRRKDLSLIFEDDIKNPETEYLALYALQTTYAIIVKLIACKIIEKLQYSFSTQSYYDLTNISPAELQSFFEKMEDGYSYQSNNIINFLEGDFFSWYSDKEQWNAELWKGVVKLIKQIDTYSAFSFNIIYEPIDIFKDLYMSIIPGSVRHSMGEYFTPKWLSNYVVKESTHMLQNPNWKAIDPCCGSGIFLISLIKEIVGNTPINSMSSKAKNDLKNNILNRVYGIDINPLSVLSARVGYYLALQPFGNLADVEIPVYLGDSAIIPQRIMIDNIDCYKYSIVNSKLTFDVILPCRFVKDDGFGQTMNELQSCVKSADADILCDTLSDKLTSREKNSNSLMKAIENLAKALVTLYKKHYDGIWIRIITNFMFVARLSDFDLIIGNPPWVKWEHLPAVYASKIKELCDIKHIFSGQHQFGGTQLNICALISNVTATNWLNNEGILAFLMPDSIMSQNSYEGFRYFYTNYEKNERLYLQKIDKWEAPLKPFSIGIKKGTQDFNTYYFSANYIDYRKNGVPVKCITRTNEKSDDELNSFQSFEEVEPFLVFKNNIACQLSANSSAFSYKSSLYDFSIIIGPTSYRYRTGVEFTPQEVYMLIGKGKSTRRGKYYFGNMKFKRSKYVVDDSPDKGWELPTDFVYPIITGPNLSLFRFDTNNEFCIIPYDIKDTTVPISEKDLRRNQKELFLYFLNHRSLMDQQSEKSKSMHRGNEFYALAKLGPYTFAENIVAAKDNGKFCASVINKTVTPWNEKKQTIGVKHTILISQDINGRFIDSDEAYYICGILNSPIVRDYIVHTFKSNGISLNKSNIYLPLYDPTNQLHIEIANLAKDASYGQGNIDDICLKIDKLYIKICKNR